MKTVILCGGRGTRLNEMGAAVPKALLTIGGKPVLWHLMRSFTSHGFTEFVLCLGHLGDQIKEYFTEIALPDDAAGAPSLKVVSDGLECRLMLADTGLDTNTGGRVNAVKELLTSDERFFVTYGDGLSDVDLAKLLDFHKRHGKTATLTAVHPVSNFGILDLDDDCTVREFREKPKLENWINGGFFVFERNIFDHLSGNAVLEREPLSTLASMGELKAYRHSGFWKCMDTYKDNVEFNELWRRDAPWMTWK